MSVSYPALLAGPAAPALTPVRLADLTAKQLAVLLVAPPPHLLVDCGGRRLPHPLGVCRFVTQLLQISQRGTRLGLCNVHPSLHRSLWHLKLDDLFHLDE
ncbi:hypothetical protein [Hymenobacter sp. UYCo722]|uniref:hypothetical protein n=1 Tax=Hymenobacter sp. UYCo722 TaxID=3156335 RepID=UPI003399879E